MKTALITGISGQDGAYLAQLLLSKGYRVLGTCRQSSSLWRLQALELEDRVEVLPLEQPPWPQLLQSYQPAEIYNLAAQSSVADSWHHPLETCHSNALSVAQLLQALRHFPEIRLFQASSSEIFAQGGPLDENSPLGPSNPYGASKLYAHCLTTSFRQHQRLFACCGILFNHESPLRGPQFVTRKIARGLAHWARGQRQPLRLGNLLSQRDWGYAGDYVQAMWSMLQADMPDDYVLASGHCHSVAHFVELVAQALELALEWLPEGGAIEAKSGLPLIEIDPLLFRPQEAAAPWGRADKALAQLGWQASTPLAQIASWMAQAEWERCGA